MTSGSDTEPEPVPAPDTANPLLLALAQTPMRLLEVDDPGFLLPDWVVTTPRLTYSTPRCAKRSAGTSNRPVRLWLPTGFVSTSPPTGRQLAPSAGCR